MHRIWPLGLAVLLCCACSDDTEPVASEQPADSTTTEPSFSVSHAIVTEQGSSFFVLTVEAQGGDLTGSLRTQIDDEPPSQVPIDRSGEFREELLR